MRALPSPSQEATVRRIALEEGVNPDVLVSIWEQESSKSVDPALTGPVLPQGHKYAGAYGQGPFQIMSFHGEMPNDFEAQARWAARHLKQKGVRGYYGKTAGGGSATPTGMPGFPSTDSYEQQVMARVPGAGMLAQAGTPDVPQGLLSQAQSISPPVRQQEENMDTQGSGGGLLSNPWLLIGASILANNDSKNTGKVLGKGLLGGTAAWQAMKQQQLIEQQRQMQIEMARRKQIEDAQNEQMRMEFLRRIQGSGGQPGAGMAPQDLARLGMEGAVMGVPGAGSVMQYGLGMIPYGAVTQAERLAEQQREWSRQKDLIEMYDQGKLPSGGGPQAAPQGLGLSPEAMRDIAKKREEARTTSTADQKKYAGWAQRMAASEPDMEKLEKEFYKGGGISYKDYYSAENTLTTGFASPEYQQYLTHARDWIGALLRYESGAAVPEPEFWRYYKTYFAQPGEDKSVIEIKRNKRRRAAASLGTAAGAAMGNATEIPPLPPGFVPEN